MCLYFVRVCVCLIACVFTQYAVHIMFDENVIDYDRKKDIIHDNSCVNNNNMIMMIMS